ncbi:MAG: GNAT family N-acetyltransferase [Rubrivivax sp.]|nr:GNAT family N-acetyltransferase [Rubrivivax sp.]
MKVELPEVTAQTLGAVCKLDAEANDYVAPNVYSIAQAYFHPEAWFRAIYADGEPVGFVMLEDRSLRTDPPPEPCVLLWRYMVHKPRQRQGLGRAALQLVIADVRRRHPTLKTFITSCMPGPQSPRAFYESLGFVATGEKDEDEDILVLDLTQPSGRAR